MTARVLYGSAGIGRLVPVERSKDVRFKGRRTGPASSQATDRKREDEEGRGGDAGAGGDSGGRVFGRSGYGRGGERSPEGGPGGEPDAQDGRGERGHEQGRGRRPQRPHRRPRGRGKPGARRPAHPR